VEKIGRKLREQREALGLSIEDISAKTRLTVNHIKAIEEGDISYFKDDLSYLRFFLRSYCSVLDMDFEEIKEDLHSSIDDYTESFSVEMMRQHREIEKNVRKNADKAVKPTMHKKERTRRNRRTVDVSMLSFLVIVLLVIACLVYAVYMFAVRDDGEGTGTADNTIPPVTDVTDTPVLPPEVEKPDPEPPVEEKKPFAISAVNDTQYTLENLEDGDEIVIEIVFGSYSHFRFLLNDAVQSEPASKVYNYKETIHIKKTVQPGMKLSLGFGFMQGNTIRINGVDVQLSSAVATSQGAVTLDFHVKGE
jgi:cytoskeletal protein RodZ